MNLNKITCYRYSLPFREEIRLGDSIHKARQGVVFALESDASSTGWGEAAPLPGFSYETLETVLAISREVSQRVCGMTLEAVRQEMDAGVISLPSLYFAFDSALHQLEDQTPESPDMTVPLCALVTGDMDSAYTQADAALQKGYQTVKVKVGVNKVEEDIRKIKRLLSAFTGSCRWRFDANRAWDYETALRFCEVIAGDDAVDYIEEPLREFWRMPQLAEDGSVPCAVDETLQELSCCLFSKSTHFAAGQEAMLRQTVEYAQALVWKPTLCMNPKRMHLDRVAPVVLSGAYESGIGTAAILEYARQIDGECPLGIDTYSRLDRDVLEERLPVDCGTVRLSDIKTSVTMGLLEEVWHV